MKKTFILMIMFLCSMQIGHCTLNKDGINLYNLKKDNMYIMSLDSKAQKIDISDEKVVNILPVNSAYEDKRQLFIEALENGVCDVNLTMSDTNYKIRFVTGSEFQDTCDDILPLDIPWNSTEE